jgi:hypothetical protein
VVLIWAETGVLRAAIVQHLDLYADVSGVAFQWRPDADAVIGVLGQTDIEAKNEVRILFLRIQVSTVFLRRINDTIVDLVALARLVLGGSTPPIDPSRQVLAVEK